MNSSIISWLSNNWVGLLGVIAAVWIPIALRPRPRLRFWTTGEGLANTYLGGSTRTILNIRNVGSQPIDDHQWRVPLALECEAGISKVSLVGVSRDGIGASAELGESQANHVPLKLSLPDRGDEVAFEIEHGKTSLAPQLTGELLGAPDSIARRLTLQQRLVGLF